MEAVEVQTTGIQTNEYIAKSDACDTIQTIVPASMRYDMNQAMSEIDRKVDGVDHYVAEKLGYCISGCNTEQYKEGMTKLCDAFGAEQVDAIAVAIYNIEQKKQGVIIADSAGVGKGRIASGIIRYATKMGLQPIFLTEKPNLFSDLFRDIIDIKSDDAIPLETLQGYKEVEKKISKEDVSAEEEEESDEEGFEEEETQTVRVPIYKVNKEYSEDIRGKKQFVPFIINGRSEKTVIKDLNGNIIYKGLPKAQNDTIIAGDTIPKQYSFALATYSQFRSAKENAKMTFLRRIAKDNIIICDESHNSSGASHTGVFLKEVLEDARGVTFLSATFAKRPDNMPIYASKTSMVDANLTDEKLVDAITAGGVALQEIVSSALVSEGQLLRRERSFEGVEVNWIYLDETQTLVGKPHLNKEQEHRAIMDSATDIIRDIMTFQTDYVDPEIEAMDNIAKAEYKEVEQRKGTEKAGINNAPVFSGIFNIVNQLLFSIKAEAVAEVAIEHIKAGRKPVIAFANTMESFLNTLIGDDGNLVEVGDPISSDFSKILEKRLNGVLRYTEIDPDGKREYKLIDIHAMSPELRVEYSRIMTKIKTASIGISSSPVDVLIDRIEKAGFSVAEITGRDRQLKLLDKGMARIQSRIKMTPTDSFRDFNENKYDCLLINQSGSTGASAHAKPNDKVPASKVKQRVMIILQAELNINTEIQKRGRIHRTGQIFLPMYDYVVSAIPAEKRLMMMLQKKIKSLDANVTSNQKESKKVINIQDFLNKYGDIVVEQYLKDNPLINLQLDDPLKLQELEEGKESQVQDKAQKVSGRVAILPIKDQENFYNEMSQQYSSLVDYLIQSGEYDLEVENMNLEAETLEKDIVIVGKGGNSVFGRNSVLEKVRVNNLKKPFTKKELDKLIKEGLNGFNADDLREKTIEKYDRFIIFTLKNDLKDNDDHYEKLIAGVRNEKQIIGIMNAIMRERAIEKRIATLMKVRGDAENRIVITSKNKQEHISKMLGFFYVGKVIGYPGITYGQDGTFHKGVFLGFDINESIKNPYAPSAIKLRFATISSQRYIAVPASKYDVITNIRSITYSDILTDDQETVVEHWDELIKEKSTDKAIRYIVTGNILQAFGNPALKGSLVSYTTSEKGVKKGILLPEGFSKDADRANNKKELRITVPIIKALPVIKSMIDGRSMTTTDGFSFQKRGDAYYISVFKGKKGSKFFSNEVIIKLTNEGLFNSSGGSMVATLQYKKITNLVQYLQDEFNSSVELVQQEFDTIKGSIAIEDYADEVKKPETDVFKDGLKDEDVKEREKRKRESEAKALAEEQVKAANELAAQEANKKDGETFQIEKRKFAGKKKMLNILRLMQGKEIMACGGKIVLT